MKIGIIVALKSEVSKNFLKGWKQHKLCGIQYYTKEDVCLVFSGVGKVNASIATFFLVGAIGVKIIFNIGSCGSNMRNSHKGDFYSISKARYIDVDNRAFNYDIGQIPQENKWFEIKRNKLLPKLTIKSATLGSTDSFVGFSNKSKFSIDKDIDLIDMEGTSIIQTCNKLNFYNLYLIKVISDSINKKGENWDKGIKDIHSIIDDIVKSILK